VRTFSKPCNRDLLSLVAELAGNLTCFVLVRSTDMYADADCLPPPPSRRQHFHKDVRKQLYSDNDDRQFFDRIKCALKTIEGRLEEGRVALQHLELFLVNVACDDPGATIGSQLVLPLLQVGAGNITAVNPSVM
jgi:hypothetical protein